jgi:hypothetical protein
MPTGRCGRASFWPLPDRRHCQRTPWPAGRFLNRIARSTVDDRRRRWPRAAASGRFHPGVAPRLDSPETPLPGNVFSANDSERVSRRRLGTRDACSCPSATAIARSPRCVASPENLTQWRSPMGCDTGASSVVQAHWSAMSPASPLALTTGRGDGSAVCASCAAAP